MTEPLARARQYLDALEADRQAALAASAQKAEEAKLIKARQEGFEAAMQMLGGQTRTDRIESLPEANEPGARRTRRHIPELILRELSFSGQAVTARQIAKAIDYTLEGTEKALKRLEKGGQVLCNDGGRWAIALAQLNGHTLGAGGNGTSSTSPNPAYRD
jgi:DNA-binding transcriptional ArsR family regulator